MLPLVRLKSCQWLLLVRKGFRTVRRRRGQLFVADGGQNQWSLLRGIVISSRRGEYSQNWLPLREAVVRDDGRGGDSSGHLGSWESEWVIVGVGGSRNRFLVGRGGRIPDRVVLDRKSELVVMDGGAELILLEKETKKKKKSPFRGVKRIRSPREGKINRPLEGRELVLENERELVLFEKERKTSPARERKQLILLEKENNSSY